MQKLCNFQQRQANIRTSQIKDSYGNANLTGQRNTKNDSGFRPSGNATHVFTTAYRNSYRFTCSTISC